MNLTKSLTILLCAVTPCFAMEQDPHTPLSARGKILPLMMTPEVLSPIANYLDLKDALTSATVCMKWAEIVNGTIRSLKVAKDVTDVDFMQLIKRFPKLTSLDLSWNHTITDDTVSQLTGLTSLNLVWNKKITDKAVSQLTHLISLNLASNKMITDAAISQLTCLNRLNLKNNNTITNQAVVTLKEQGALKTVLGRRI